MAAQLLERFDCRFLDDALGHRGDVLIVVAAQLLERFDCLGVGEVLKRHDLGRKLVKPLECPARALEVLARVVVRRLSDDFGKADELFQRCLASGAFTSGSGHRCTVYF